MSENVLKSCNYSSVVCGEVGGAGGTGGVGAVGGGSKSIFAVGSDKKLKEIGDSQINKDIECDVCLTQLAISGSGRMLFAGTETGTVRAYRYIHRYFLYIFCIFY